MTTNEAHTIIRAALAPDRPPETFAEHLRTLRVSRGRTLGEVAGWYGISVVYLSEIERDRKAPPNEALIEAIVSSLGGDVPKMLGLASVARGHFVLPVAVGDVQRRRLGTVLLERWAHLTDGEMERLIEVLDRTAS